MRAVAPAPPALRALPLPPRRRKRVEAPPHPRPPKMHRTYREPTEADLAIAERLLSPLGLTREVPDAPVNRIFLVQRAEDAVTAIGVLDKHGPVGVLRGVGVEPRVRRLTHGTLLATQLLKRAHYERIVYVYAAGVVPDFLDALGFVEVKRTDLPRQTLALPGLAGSTLPIFEMKTRKDGALRANAGGTPRR